MTFKLIANDTKLELREGSEVQHRRKGAMILSGLVPKANTIYLIDPEDDGDPMRADPDAIGARFVRA